MLRNEFLVCEVWLIFVLEYVSFCNAQDLAFVVALKARFLLPFFGTKIDNFLFIFLKCLKHPNADLSHFLSILVGLKFVLKSEIKTVLNVFLTRLRALNIPFKFSHISAYLGLS